MVVAVAMIAVVVAVVVAVSAVIMSAMFTMVVVSTIIVTITMLFAVTGGIFAVVPVVPHEVDPFATGIVFTAVLAPVFGMAGRYAQINRRAIAVYALDHHWLLIHHLWLRITTEVDPTIEARLTNADRNAYIGCDCRGTDHTSTGSNYRGGHQ